MLSQLMGIGKSSAVLISGLPLTAHAGLPPHLLSMITSAVVSILASIAIESASKTSGINRLRRR